MFTPLAVSLGGEHFKSRSVSTGPETRYCFHYSKPHKMLENGENAQPGFSESKMMSVSACFSHSAVQMLNYCVKQ